MTNIVISFFDVVLMSLLFALSIFHIPSNPISQTHLDLIFQPSPLELQLHIPLFFKVRGLVCTITLYCNHIVWVLVQDEEFIIVLPKGVPPHTRHVRGSNYCLLNVFEDRISGRAIIISVVSENMRGWKTMHWAL